MYAFLVLLVVFAQTVQTHVKGPPPPVPLESDLPSTFLDAVIVAEFISRFADVLEMAPVSMYGLRQAARWPLETGLLADTYCGLLRMLLLDCLTPESGMKSRCGKPVPLCHR
jgi:hypothetical protein